MSLLISVMIVAPSARTLRSRPDQVARKVVFLSCLSSSCLKNSSPMNSTSVSSKGPTEGTRLSPPLQTTESMSWTYYASWYSCQCPAAYHDIFWIQSIPTEISSGCSFVKCLSWSEDYSDEEEGQCGEIDEFSAKG